MKFNNIELPSNKKFGYFFSFVFFICASYFYIEHKSVYGFLFLALCLLLLTVTIFKSESLLPLNKLWMRFGLILGMIISPIILGILFFFIFTPLGISMRIFGRDELFLKMKTKKSHWINVNQENIFNFNFKNQF